MTIVGYTYKADNYCPTCVIERMVRDGDASPAACDMRVETVLDQIADANGIDRYDEATFDSGDFPKVIVRTMRDGDPICGNCGELL